MFLSAPDHFSLCTHLFSPNQTAEVVGIHLVVNWYAWFVVIGSHLEDFWIKPQIQRNLPIKRILNKTITIIFAQQSSF